MQQSGSSAPPDVEGTRKTLKKLKRRLVESFMLLNGVVQHMPFGVVVWQFRQVNPDSAPELYLVSANHTASKTLGVSIHKGVGDELTTAFQADGASRGRPPIPTQALDELQHCIRRARTQGKDHIDAMSLGDGRPMFSVQAFPAAKNYVCCHLKPVTGPPRRHTSSLHPLGGSYDGNISSEDDSAPSARQRRRALRSKAKMLSEASTWLSDTSIDSSEDTSVDLSGSRGSRVGTLRRHVKGDEEIKESAMSDVPEVTVNSEFGPGRSRVAKAMYDFVGDTSKGQLTIAQGGIVSILGKEHRGWVMAECGGLTGYVPTNYLEAEPTPSAALSKTTTKTSSTPPSASPSPSPRLRTAAPYEFSVLRSIDRTLAHAESPQSAGFPSSPSLSSASAQSPPSHSLPPDSHLNSLLLFGDSAETLSGSSWSETAYSPLEPPASPSAKKRPRSGLYNAVDPSSTASPPLGEGTSPDSSLMVTSPDDDSEEPPMSPWSADITRRMEGMELSKSVFKSIFDATSIGLCMTDINTKFLQVNKRLCDNLGYPKEQFLGTSLVRITYGEDVKTLEQLLRRAVSGNLEHFSFVMRLLHADGTPIWCLVNAQVHNKADGSLEALMLNVQNLELCRQRFPGVFLAPNPANG